MSIARRAGASLMELRWIGIDKYSTGRGVIETMQKLNGIANINIEPSGHDLRSHGEIQQDARHWHYPAAGSRCDRGECEDAI